MCPTNIFLVLENMITDLDWRWYGDELCACVGDVVGVMRTRNQSPFGCIAVRAEDRDQKRCERV